MHLPSAEKVWQMPGARALPMPLRAPLRVTPLEVQATSYLAASERIVSLSNKSVAICRFMVVCPFHIWALFYIELMFVFLS